MTTANLIAKRNHYTDLEPIHLLYDERMLLHRPLGWIEPAVFPEYLDEVEDDYPMENPERLRVVYERLCALRERLVYEEDTDTVFHPLHCEMATKEQILLAHSREQYERLEQLETLSEPELLALSGNMSQSDMYYCQESFKAARLAAGGLLSCVDAACEGNLNGTTNKALALVRPPGHHACQSKEMGFCFIDSVVVAAKYAIKTNKAKKVCILDWDIHDGNVSSHCANRIVSFLSSTPLTYCALPLLPQSNRAHRKPQSIMTISFALTFTDSIKRTASTPTLGLPTRSGLAKLEVSI